MSKCEPPSPSQSSGTTPLAVELAASSHIADLLRIVGIKHVTGKVFKCIRVRKFIIELRRGDTGSIEDTYVRIGPTG
jgi:hypothetical protein